jgi:hypothetical protein
MSRTFTITHLPLKAVVDIDKLVETFPFFKGMHEESAFLDDSTVEFEELNKYHFGLLELLMGSL